MQPTETIFHILDAVSGLVAVRLSADLAAKVKAREAITSPLELIRNAAEIADLIRQITGLGEPEDDGLSDDPNAENYRWKDTGYIADSRKELAASLIRKAKESGQRVLATDLDWEEVEKNPRAAAEIIIKSNLFGAVDWDKLRGDGMEPGAGFLIDRVYASIAPQPSENSTQARKDYALALQTIRDRLEAALTVPAVLDVLSEIKDELFGVQLNADEADQYKAITAQIGELQERRSALENERKALAEPAAALNREINGLEWDQQKRTRRNWKHDPEIDAKLAELKPKRDAALAALAAWEAEHPELIERWDTKRTADGGVEGNAVSGLRSQISALARQREAITKAAQTRNLTESPLTRGWLTFGERFFKLLQYRSYRGSDTFAGHVTNARTGKIADWSWAEKERVVVKKATKQEIGFQLKVADHFERVGGTPVKVESTLALEKMLGLRAVQSGNWVLKDPNSAKFHVEQTAAAMLDMSDVLGVDVHALGLGGRLGMAFGARGTGNTGFGGAAKAHYESVHRVINLTKMGGGGSLGHEFGHAFDDILAELATGKPGEVRNYASDNPGVLPAGPLQDAMRAVSDIIHTGTRRLGEVIKIGPKDKERAQYNIDTYTRADVGRQIKAAGNLEAAVLAVDAYFARYTDKRSLKQAKQWRTLAAAYYADDGADSVVAATGPAVSNFMAEAVILDNGVRGKYWSKPHEMFARAFQSYLEDKLAEQGRKNDYLSVYADNKYHFDPIFGIQWNPYPEGDERTRINAAFDRLFAVVRGEQIFEKAVANKPLLDSIFGVMGDE